MYQYQFVALAGKRGILNVIIVPVNSNRMFWTARQYAVKPKCLKFIIIAALALST